MAGSIILYQGADRDIVVTHDEATLVSATEIECRISANGYTIDKTLTGSGISGVTATEFTVTIDDGDTADIPSGHYEIQYRYTSASGTVTHGVSSPTQVEIRDSIFTDVA